jgi:4-diphosphocytidyl-2-C-methyl-D-erythritol kinase
MIESIKAYAKINLHLEVLNKRPDSYHNICSIMAKINIFDLLQLEGCELCNPNTIDITIRCIGGQNAAIVKELPIEQNLITKAIRLYCSTAHIGSRVTIAIQKEIPSGAGLGGGSADAAAALMLCNNVFNKFSHNELMALAAEIGADVPFCLNGHIALCEGKGEIVTPLKKIPLPDSVVIVFNDIHSSTKEAYTALMRSFAPVLSKKDAVLSLWDKNDVVALLKIFQNDFQEILFDSNPQLKGIYLALQGFAPDFIQMTGSGSALFALFSDFGKAYEVFLTLKPHYTQVFVSNLLMT